MSLTDLCGAVATDLRALGIPELVAVAEAAVSVAKTDIDLDGCFALDLLAAFPGEAALVGRFLDLLKSRATGAPATPRARKITIREAVAEFQSGAWLRLAATTRNGYGRDYRRLVDAYGDDPVDSVRSGDLSGLVGRLMEGHDPYGKFHGKGAVRSAISAYRTLWEFFDEQGYADERVAKRVKKPTLPPTSRRRLEHSEMQVVRHLASEARDPLKDMCMVILCQTLLMRKMEGIAVPISAYKRDRGVIGVYGKRNKWREIPVAPRAAVFLDTYIESRRPSDVDPLEWWASDEKLLRYRPTKKYPHGKPLGDDGWDSVFERFQKLAPSIFSDGDVVMHSYRHSGGTWLERNVSPAVAQGALGHSAENPTQIYTKANLAEIRAGLTAYEEWVYGPGDLLVPARPDPLYPPPTTAEFIASAA